MITYLRQVLPFAIGLCLAMLLLLLGSSHPDLAIRAFFWTPFSNAFYLGNLIDNATLILLCALGFLTGMRMGVFNLGGEGQSYLGALAALEFSLALPGLAAPLGVFLGLLAAVLAASLVGALAGIIRRFLGINELITTFLLSSALIPLIDYGVAGPLRNPAGNLLATPEIPSGWRLPALLAPSGLNIGLFLVLGVVLAAWFILERSRFGYEQRLAGASVEFARSQGVPLGALAITSLGASAGLHGLAGGLAVYGTYHAVYTGLTAGLGWNGIAAALIGRNSPWGAVVGAFLFAWMGAGAHAAMIHTDFTFELAGFIQASVFLFITMESGSARRTARTAGSRQPAREEA
jgi:simple sugar transport system permease protein